MPSKTRKYVPDTLRSLGDLYRERNRSYGDSYLKYGKIMTALFPDGITLKSEEDFNRIGALSCIVSKMARYTNNLEVPHRDSLHDIAVYSIIIDELDSMEGKNDA